MKIIVYNTEKVELLNLLNKLGYFPFLDSLHFGDAGFYNKNNREGCGFYILDIDDGKVMICPRNSECADFIVWDDAPIQDILEFINFIEDLLNHEIVEDERVDRIIQMFPLPKPQVSHIEEFKPLPVERDYLLTTRLVEDVMFYQVDKPNVDRPFTTYTSMFSKYGHLDFFTSFFVSSAWGAWDRPFFKYFWDKFEMDGVFDLEKLIQDRIDSCKPPVFRSEPEVYRKTIDEVIVILNNKRGV